MGYYVSFIEAHFIIKKKNFDPCLQTIKGIDKGAWVKDPEKDNDLVSILDAWRWKADLDDKGNINNLWFEGEKLGDEDTLFLTIAPYVESGCYVEMSGEENARWRWTFNNGKMEEVSADICWNDESEIVANILKQKALLPTLLGVHPILDEMIGRELK